MCPVRMFQPASQLLSFDLNGLSNFVASGTQFATGIDSLLFLFRYCSREFLPSLRPAMGLIKGTAFPTREGVGGVTQTA